jgi:flagellar protein FlgJ
MNLEMIQNNHGIGQQNPNSRDIQLREQSKKLESVFLTYVFKSMEKTVQKSGLFEKNNNNLASMMFSQTMAETVSNGHGIGLGDNIYNSLKGKSGPVDFSKTTKVAIDQALDAMSLSKVGGEL